MARIMQFKIKQITDKIFCITEPFYSEHANIYVFKGHEFDLVIDAGLGVLNLKTFLEQKGFNPKILITHAHFDHLGGLIHFQPEELILLPKVRENLQQPKLWGLDYLNEEDFTAAVNKAELIKSWEQIKTIVATVKPYLDSELIHDNYRFELIPTPGHSDDGFVLFDEDKRLLVSADTLYDGKPLVDLSNSDLSEFKESLNKIANLDFKFVLPGHNQCFTKELSKPIIRRWLNTALRN